MRHRYTEEQRSFIKLQVKGKTTEELTRLVNERFNLELEPGQIRAFKKNYQLTSDVDTKFVPGRESLNKGGRIKGGEPFRFKRGHRPYNYMPVGTERINGDGYVDIKVADPTKWRGKHLVLWEAANGPVPKGHVVLFADQDRHNFDLDNLILISKRQLLTLNRHKLIQRDTELTKTALLIADILQAVETKKK